MRRLAFGTVALWCLSTVCAQGRTIRLSLQEAETLALQKNPRVPAAQYLARAAAQLPVEERAAFQPAVSANITAVGADNGSRLAAGALNNPIVYDRIGTGIVVDQLITDFGRTRNLVASASLRAQAQNKNAQATKEEIILDTDRAYFAVLRSVSLLIVAQETVAARQLVADQISVLAQSKLKSGLDVSFANVNLATAQLQLAEAENGRKSAEADLAVAIGLTGTSTLELTEQPVSPDLPSDSGMLVRDAIQSRPDIARLRLEADAADKFTAAERDLVFPTVEATGAAGYVPIGESQIPERFGAAGINVRIPVFNGGLFSARRREAAFRAKAAEQNVHDLEARVARDVKIAYLNAMTARQRLDLTARLLAQSQLALDLAQSRYDLGLSSIVELSQAQLNLTSARIANTSSKYEYQATRAILKYETGVE